MATYAAWNEHFDKVNAAKLKSYIKAIETLEKDSMISREYGTDLRSLKILINSSKNMR